MCCIEPELLGGSRRRAAVAALCLAVLVPGRDARAHMARASYTLHQLVLASELVVRARILEVGPGTADVALRGTIVRIEILEVLKGEAPRERRVCFAPHGHGDARYEAGTEVLAFLRPISSSPELARTALAEHAPYVSVEDHTEPVLLDAGSRSALVQAARAYVALDRSGDAAALVDGMRRITLELLSSPEPRLAAWALRDLASAAAAPLFAAADVPRLLSVVDDPARAIAFRAGLLLEMERRGLVDGAERIRSWLESPDPGTVVAAIHAAARSDDAALLDPVAALARHRDPAVREAATRALGGLGRHGAEVLGILASRLDDPEPRVAHAAVRALGELTSADALRLLESAARTNRDEGVRRASTAELAVGRARREGAPR